MQVFGIFINWVIFCLIWCHFQLNEEWRQGRVALTAASPTHLCKNELGSEVEGVQFVGLLQLPPLLLYQALDGVLQLLAVTQQRQRWRLKARANVHRSRAWRQCCSRCRLVPAVDPVQLEVDLRLDQHRLPRVKVLLDLQQQLLLCTAEKRRRWVVTSPRSAGCSGQPSLSPFTAAPRKSRLEMSTTVPRSRLRTSTFCRFFRASRCVCVEELHTCTVCCTPGPVRAATEEPAQK